jgi:ABC-type nitrate/sulfonate/bicarbonate transport system ATPase subunit
MAAQYIYTMRDLRRFYPPDREVLKGINLSFYPGAKIGVIGSNGSGKSSLLRIMAGEDEGFSGEARLTAGFTVGHLAQEPQLDPDKDVLGNVSDGIAETKALVDRFNEVCAAMGSPDADFDKLLTEQAELQDKIDAAGAWDLERTFEIAMDALRLPPGDADVTTLSGGERRRVALCRLLLSKPDLLLLDEPTNHLDAESVAWLERTLQDYPGGSSSSIAVPASPGRGTTPRGSSRSRPAWPGNRRLTSPASRHCSGSWSGFGCPPVPATARARLASTPTTSWWPRPRQPTVGPTSWRSPSLPAPASAIGWSTPRAWSKGTVTGS